MRPLSRWGRVPAPPSWHGRHIPTAHAALRQVVVFLFGREALAAILGVRRFRGRASRVVGAASHDPRRQHEFAIAGPSQLDICLSSLSG